MKNILLYCLILLVISANYAQKKPVKKITTSSKNKVWLPPPKKVVKEEIIQISQPSTKSYGNPTIMVSAEESKFENEKICIDCDTLILDSGKPHIVIYDVKWMSNSENRTYKKQPTKDDLSLDYFKLGGLAKREWDELHRNFPENEVVYHHIYRNTFIKADNLNNESVNLLNRQERHEGIIYWSGKPNDKLLQNTSMVSTTEKISKIRNINKTSSYYSTFKKDSLMIENLQKDINPDKNLQQNMNAFLIKEVVDEYILPIQFLNLEKVYRINFEINDKEKFHFTFNEFGQLIEFIEDGRGTFAISYENDLPKSILRDGKIKKKFYYSGTKIIVKNEEMISIYELIGKVFLYNKQFYTSKKSYSELDLQSPVSWKTDTENGKLCHYMTRSDDRSTSTTCYSNNQYNLPLYIDNEYHNFSSRTSFIYENNELSVESSNEYKSTKMIFTLDNQVLKQIKYFKKRNSDEYKEVVTAPIRYEYYK